MPVRDPSTSEILQQLQTKMAEKEKIVGEVGGLVTLVEQLAKEEDEETARAVERTRRAFQFVRSAPRRTARTIT